MSDLSDLHADLLAAASAGGAEAGAAAVQAGVLRAELGLRLPGQSSTLAASGLGGLSARIGATQRRGVYQEQAPVTAAGVNTAAIADAMAEVAAAQGAAALRGH